jgi:hypothetical protein
MTKEDMLSVPFPTNNKYSQGLGLSVFVVSFFVTKYLLVRLVCLTYDLLLAFSCTSFSQSDLLALVPPPPTLTLSLKPQPNQTLVTLPDPNS